MCKERYVNFNFVTINIITIIIFIAITIIAIVSYIAIIIVIIIIIIIIIIISFRVFLRLLQLCKACYESLFLPQKLAMIKGKMQKQAVTKSRAGGPICVWNLGSCSVMRTLNGANADDIFVVDRNPSCGP